MYKSVLEAVGYMLDWIVVTLLGNQMCYRTSVNKQPYNLLLGNHVSTFSYKWKNRVSQQGSHHYSASAFFLPRKSMLKLGECEETVS